MYLCFVEDELHEALVLRVCDYLNRQAPKIFIKKGKTKLIDKTQVRKLNRDNNNQQFFMVVDLDNDSACAAAEKRRLLNGDTPSPALKIIIAVRAAEAWLLADRHELATYLGVALKHLPQRPEGETKPKETLINIARKSRNRHIKTALVPITDTAKQGPEYNTQIADYVRDRWNLEAAKNNAASLIYLCRILTENLPKS